jgi:hypothetical protein
VVLRGRRGTNRKEVQICDGSLYSWGLAATSLAFASQAAAATTTSVSMSFTEQIVANFNQGCPVFPDGLCGNGVVLPFGHVTETIQFGAGCGDGSCDLRTIYLPGGSIVSNEQFAPGRCPGVCQPNRVEPRQGLRSDTIIGGTETFTGATGALAGRCSPLALQARFISLARSLCLN